MTMHETNNRPKAGGLMSSPPFYLDFRGRFHFKKLERWTQADSNPNGETFERYPHFVEFQAKFKGLNGLQRAELYLKKLYIRLSPNV